MEESEVFAAANYQENKPITKKIILGEFISW